MRPFAPRFTKLVAVLALVLSTRAPACSQAPLADPAQRLISLNLRDVPLRTAIETVFTGSGLQYMVEPSVPNVPVTMNLRDVALQSALRLVIRNASTQAPGLTLLKEQDIYVIRLRQQENASVEPVTEKISIQFLRASELATQLGSSPLPDGVVAITPVGADNSLLIRGTPEALVRLRPLIRLLDIPTQMLSLSIGVTGPGLAGRPLQLRSLARTLSGQEVIVDERTDANGQNVRLKVTVRPIIQGDGTLLVDSDWDLSIPVHGGAKGPIRLVKRLRTTARMMSGRGSAIGEVDLGPWGGKGVVRLWLRATILKEGAE